MISGPGIVRRLSHDEKIFPFPDLTGHFLIGGRDLL